MSAWGATLRIAQRDARRARGRSALVVVMIALPILGVGMADVLYRTFQLTPEQKATRYMGAADGLLTDSGQVTVQQDAAGNGYSSGPDVPQRVGPAPSPASVLPAGSRVLVTHADQGNLTRGDVTVVAQLSDLPYNDPLARGIYRPVSGRPPVRPGEIAVTTEVARRLRAGLGDRVLLGGTPLTVTGVIASESTVHERVALYPTGALARTATVDRVLVDVPGKLTLADVRRANARGFTLQPRVHLAGLLPQEGITRLAPTTLTFAGLIAGLVLLEIVLLAGPAFAVGVKRRSRDLALIAATGGERRHLRRVVLGGGLVLGAAGGVLGAGLGIGLARLLEPVFTDLQDSRPGPFEVRPVELVAIVGVGVLTALLAALLPARTAARADVLAALTGRRGTVRSGRRLPALGVVATVAGAALALHGARTLSTNLVLAGSIVAELGLVATTPFLVGLVARAGRWLPVGPRFALRDAARNRGRTAPAVSAILAAVAGAIAVSTFVGSLDRHDRKQYQQQAASGSVTVDLTYEGSARAGEVHRVLAATLPGTEVETVKGFTSSFSSPDQVRTVFPADNPARSCPVTAHLSSAALRRLAHDPRCARFPGFSQLGGPGAALVGDAATLRALTGVSGPAYAQVLARGGAVVPWADLQDDGTVVLDVGDEQRNVLRHVTVPAVGLPTSVFNAVVISDAAAARLGLPVKAVGVVALGSHAPSSHDEDRARNGLAALGLNDLQVERGYQSRYGVGLLALLLGSSVIVLGASGTATGLAAADGRTDLATLAAVGATPRTRRTLAAFQSAATAGLGTVLGVVAGLVPGVGVVLALNAATQSSPLDGDAYPLALPWTNVLVTLVVVPALAALAAAALTRSRLPVVSRIG